MPRSTGAGNIYRLSLLVLLRLIYHQCYIEGDVDCSYFDNYRYTLGSEFDPTDSSETLLLGTYGTYDIKNDEFTPIPWFATYLGMTDPSVVWKVKLSSILLENMREESKLRDSSNVFGRVQVAYYNIYIEPTLIIGVEYQHISDIEKDEICKATHLGYFHQIVINKPSVCKNAFAQEAPGTLGQSLMQLARVDTDTGVIDFYFDNISGLLESTVSKIPVIFKVEAKYEQLCDGFTAKDTPLNYTYVLKSGERNLCYVQGDITRLRAEMEGLHILITDGGPKDIDVTIDGLQCMLVDGNINYRSNFELKAKFGIMTKSSTGAKDSDDSETDDKAEKDSKLLFWLTSAAVILCILHLIAVYIMIRKKRSMKMQAYGDKRASKVNEVDLTIRFDN